MSVQLRHDVGRMRCFLSEKAKKAKEPTAGWLVITRHNRWHTFTYATSGSDLMAFGGFLPTYAWNGLGEGWCHGVASLLLDHGRIAFEFLRFLVLLCCLCFCFLAFLGHYRHLSY